MNSACIRREKQNEQTAHTLESRTIAFPLIKINQALWSNVFGVDPVAPSENTQYTYIDDAGIFGQAGFRDVAPDGEPGVAEFLIVLHIVAPGHRHVVHNPAKTIKSKIRENKMLVI